LDLKKKKSATNDRLTNNQLLSDTVIILSKWSVSRSAWCCRHGARCCV